jgi:hypothetical protein
VKTKEASKPRAGWEEAARVMRERGEDTLLDDFTATDFDESEWVWESPIQRTTDRSA